MPYSNIEDQRKYSREHYQKNKEYYKTKAKRNDKVNRKYLRSLVDRYKLLVGCIDCGYKSNPRALQFDHVRGTKIDNISDMVMKTYSVQKVKDEIRKCEVRCANCHSVVTFERLK